MPSSPTGTPGQPFIAPAQLFVWLHRGPGGGLICPEGSQFEETVSSPAVSVSLSDSPRGCTPSCAEHKAVCEWK